MHHKAFVLINICSLLFLSSYHSNSFARRTRKKRVQSMRTQIKQQQKDQTLLPQHYKIKKFDVHGITDLSAPQLSQHYQLYAGYIDQRNQIDEKLKFVDRTGINNTIYSPFRSLKQSQTHARNGALLHELYFRNIGARKKMQKNTYDLLQKNFGSIAAFQKDVFDCARCTRGWVITAYCLDDGRIKNFVLDAHDQNMPVLTIPLLVIDVYEHAYTIDFGINREAYLKTLFDNIDWHVVENRVIQWINPITAQHT